MVIVDATTCIRYALCLALFAVFHLRAVLSPLKSCGRFQTSMWQCGSFQTSIFQCGSLQSSMWKCGSLKTSMRKFSDFHLPVNWNVVLDRWKHAASKLGAWLLLGKTSKNIYIYVGRLLRSKYATGTLAPASLGFLIGYDRNAAR